MCDGVAFCADAKHVCVHPCACACRLDTYDTSETLRIADLQVFIVLDFALQCDGMVTAQWVRMCLITTLQWLYG
jgi:hypothetical protein